MWPPTDHGVIVSGAERAQNIRSVIDYSPLLRACLVNLDLWVTEGIDPPESKHPRIDDGTLVPASELIGIFSSIPGSNYPFGYLCGAGVAFKVAWAVCQQACQAKKVSTPMRNFLISAMGIEFSPPWEFHLRHGN